MSHQPTEKNPKVRATAVIWDCAVGMLGVCIPLVAITDSGVILPLLVILGTCEVHTILQSHAEGCSLRGVSRISGRAYGTVVSLIRDASQKSQMVHNAEVAQVKTEKIIGDEMWSFVFKNKKTAPQKI